MEEKISKEFTRYRTPEGEPTCALQGKACVFLCTTFFGIKMVCALDTETLLKRRDFKKEGDELGYLIPNKKHCIMFGKT